MKKSCILFLLIFLPLLASADPVEIDGIYYNLVSEAKIAEVTENPNKYSGRIVIPMIVTYQEVSYNVTSIGFGAFANCGSSLTSITIPNSVISIGEYAFYDCMGLASVTIPNSVISIGRNAFSGCEGLTSITIPNSVTSIGRAAFGRCSGLTSVIIPNSVTSIDESAFGGCSSLTSITIPNSVISIGYGAFNGCSSLTSITIPNSVTSIGDGAFQLCTNLTSITIPNSVTSIGEFAFVNCKGLTSITISNSVTSISYSLFKGCSGLTSVTIPNSVTSIGSSAFRDCSSLTSITIPNSVTSIGKSAFRGCSGLTSIAIPNSVTSIGGHAFEDCNKLTIIEIGSGITDIYPDIFYKLPELKDVYCYAENVPKTDDENYEETSINATLHVPAGSVDAYKAVEPWSKFKNIVAISNESTVQTKRTIHVEKAGTLMNLISQEEKNQIEDLTLTGEINGKDIAFLREMAGGKVYSDEVQYMYGSSKGALSVLDMSEVRFVTGGLYMSVYYDGEDYYDKYESKNNDEIPSNAFCFCPRLKTIIIPNSVTTIEDEAFYGSKNLASITIPNSVTTIGNAVFNMTPWYDNQPDGMVYAGKVLYKYKGTMPDGTKISLKDGTLGIARRAFEDCSGLNSATIPNSVTSIGSYAFSDCTNMTSVNIPSNVTSIDKGTFEYCRGLSTITIPNSVISIGNGAFSHCSGLTSITIPNKVASIGRSVFSRCTGLTSVASNILNPFAISDDCFDSDIYSKVTLTVPKGTRAAYQTKYGWKEFANIVEASEDEVLNVDNISIYDLGKSTYCSNNDLDFSEFGDDLKAYVATGYDPDSKTIWMTRVTDVPAGTGIFLKGKKGDYHVPVKYSTSYYKNMLVGTLSSTNIPSSTSDYTNLYLAKDGGELKFCTIAGDGRTMGANKAYLQIPKTFVSCPAMKSLPARVSS